MTLPNVFLLGAPKAGTTSLACWLQAHPDVFVSVPKEPYYWASDYPRMRQHYGFDERRDYEALYGGAPAQAARYRVDGSTTYLYSQTAVPDIRSAVPDARFIVTVRNPVDLLVSWHRTQLVVLNEDEHDFAMAWRRSLAGRRPDTDPLDHKLLDYPRIGALGAAMTQLYGGVDRDRVHVIVFDDLVNRPDQVWNDLTAFLAVSSQPRPDFRAHNASDKMFRSPALRLLTHRPPELLSAPMTRLRQWSRTTRLPPVALVKRLMWRSEERPTIGREFREELSDYFREDVHQLSALISRDLGGWVTREPHTEVFSPE